MMVATVNGEIPSSAALCIGEYITARRDTISKSSYRSNPQQNAPEITGICRHWIRQIAYSPTIKPWSGVDKTWTIRTRRTYAGGDRQDIRRLATKNFIWQIAALGCFCRVGQVGAAAPGIIMKGISAPLTAIGMYPITSITISGFVFSPWPC